MKHPVLVPAIALVSLFRVSAPAAPASARASGARAKSLIVVSPPSIAKSFAFPTVPINGSVSLAFTITNPNGATDLTGVSFQDTFPPGLILANPDSFVGSCDPGTFSFGVHSFGLVGGTILAGSSCTFSVDLFAISAGLQVNTTDPVTSNEGGTGNTAIASVDVLGPDLAITKTHVGNFRQGQKGATYAITVTNRGGATTTDVVMVADTLPTGLTATGMSGSNWSCTPPSGPCTRVDGLDPTLSYETITLTVDVAPDAPSTLTNTATVSGGGESDVSNDTASDPTAIAGSDFFTLPPCRVLDTRDADGPLGGPALAPGETRVVPTASGPCGIPAAARALSLNVTAVGPGQTGLLQLYSADQPVPGTSVVAFGPGQTRACATIVVLPADGSGGVAIHNASGGPVDVVLDVSGYFE